MSLRRAACKPRFERLTLRTHKLGNQWSDSRSVGRLARVMCFLPLRKRPTSIAHNQQAPSGILLRVIARFRPVRRRRRVRPGGGSRNRSGILGETSRPERRACQPGTRLPASRDGWMLGMLGDGVRIFEPRLTLRPVGTTRGSNKAPADWRPPPDPGHQAPRARRVVCTTPWARPGSTAWFHQLTWSTSSTRPTRSRSVPHVDSDQATGKASVRI